MGSNLSHLGEAQVAHQRFGERLALGPLDQDDPQKRLQVAQPRRQGRLRDETGIGGAPEVLGDYIKTELVKWAKIVKESGARAEL